jgi:hypothetical protein
MKLRDVVFNPWLNFAGTSASLLGFLGVGGKHIMSLIDRARRHHPHPHRFHPHPKIKLHRLHP